MKEYKAPQTRIKVVEQGGEVKYYPQYKQVVVPNLWEEWHPALNHIHACEFTSYLDVAKDTIDTWLERQAIFHHEQQEKDKIKRAKINVSYLDYP